MDITIIFGTILGIITILAIATVHKESKKPKVFCKDCRHKGIGATTSMPICLESDTVTDYVNGEERYYHCCAINRYGRCKNFEQRPKGLVKK